jgi:O6-methylguanine-DNA--protein-cysteine methyltransferase
VVSASEKRRPLGKGGCQDARPEFMTGTAQCQVKSVLKVIPYGQTIKFIHVSGALSVCLIGSLPETRIVGAAASRNIGM